MTARLASHPDVVDRTPDLLERLVSAGVDVEFVGPDAGGPRDVDALRSVQDGTLDLALVGIGALRGAATEALTTVAVLPRQEMRDVLVTLSGRASPMSELPAGSRVGVVGRRRMAFLAAHRPDLDAVELDPAALEALLAARREAETNTVDATTSEGGRDAGGDVHALVVSALDARHSGLVEETVEALDPRAWPPEPGQGAFALIARHPIAEATALDHLPTRTALRAELALLDALDVDHHTALGCFAQTSGRWIRLWAAAASPDGRRLVRSDRTGPLDEPEALGSAVAGQLEERGFALVLSGAAR